MISDPTILFVIMSARTPEVWLAILGGTAYVWYKSGTTSRLGRALEAGISGLMSVALGPEVIRASDWPPALVHFLIAVVGFAILDALTSFFSDKDALTAMFKEFVKKWFNLSDNDDRGKK